MALLLLLTQGMGNSPQNTERGSAPKPSIHSVPVMIIINPSFLLADMAKLHPFARAGEGAEQRVQDGTPTPLGRALERERLLGGREHSTGIRTREAGVSWRREGR